MYGSDVAAYQNRLAAFGWDVQTVDGHDVEAIATALERSQDSDAPSAVIAQTVKGKGVDFLEDAEGRHGKPVSGDELDAARRQIEPRIHHVEYTPPNHVSLTPKPTLEREAVDLSASYDGDQVMATRTAVGHALAELGGRDPRTVLIDGDVSNSTRTEFFFSRYPERSIQGYIAEQNMVGMAVGLQARGFYPWGVSFAAFLTRAHDQIRMGAYSRATMALSGSHTGVSIGEDGPSQMGLEDIAMMRAVPDSVVLSPCDAVSAAKLTGLLRSHRGIGYLRTIRGKTPVIYGPAFSREHGGTPIFEIGGCTVLRSSDADRFLIVATGICVHEALTAAEGLDRQGIPAAVIDAYCLKPLPEAVLRTAASKVPHVVTVEDHYAQGGLSEAVAAAVSGISRVHRLAVSGIPHSGDAASLMAEYQIDAAGIQAVCKRILSADT